MDAHLTYHNTRFVVLGNARYPERQERFMENLRQRGGFLNELHLEYVVGKAHYERFTPPSFAELSRKAHYWAVCCDHMDAMETTLAMSTEYLIMLEDDADFTDDFETRFRAEIAALPEDFRCLRMGWNGDIKSGMIGNLWSRRGLIAAYDYFWRHRYRIIDHAFSDLRESGISGGWLQSSTALIRQDTNSKQQGRDC